jgi:hypothetical protein
LHVTGDDQNNDLQITQSQFNSGGPWQGVTLGLAGINADGAATTLVNGSRGADFPGVKNGVVIRLGRGNDSLLVPGGDPRTRALLPGNVLISGGHGDDDLRIAARNSTKVAVHGGWGKDNIVIVDSTLSRLVVNTNSQAQGFTPGAQDIATIRATRAKQAVVVNGGLGNDEFHVFGRCIFDGPLTMNLSSGHNTLFFSAPTLFEVPTLNGPFAVSGGGGLDALDVHGKLLGDVTIDVRGGDDFVQYLSTTTENVLDMMLGDGDDRVFLRGSLGSGVVDGGAGTDDVSRPADMNPELSLVGFESETIH